MGPVAGGQGAIGPSEGDILKWGQWQGGKGDITSNRALRGGHSEVGPVAGGQGDIISNRALRGGHSEVGPVAGGQGGHNIQ